MALPWRQIASEVFAPLALAAYAAWAVVWLVALGDLARAQPALLPLGQAAMLLFLATFVLVLAGACAQSARRFAVAATLLAGAALVVVLLRPGGTAPILLVLLAAVLANQLGNRALLLALLGINAVVLAGMVLGWQIPLPQAAISVSAFASFQAFAGLLMRSTARAEQMAGDLRAANAELLTSRTLLAEAARDGERLRLSRELHDVAGHSLTALKLNLRALAQDPRQPDPARVALCAGLADELLGSLRAVVRQLREDEEQGLDLGEAITRLGLPYPRPRLRLQIAPGIALRGRERVEAVLRAVQEALTNAARHGPARELHVQLDLDGARLRLLIEDDGRVLEPLRPGGGLAGMRERFAALGGGVEFARGDRGGLRIRAWLPREARP
jgi:signal transduction histidine kinase